MTRLRHGWQRYSLRNGVPTPDRLDPSPPEPVKKPIVKRSKAIKITKKSMSSTSAKSTAGKDKKVSVVKKSKAKKKATSTTKTIATPAAAPAGAPGMPVNAKAARAAARDQSACKWEYEFHGMWHSYDAGASNDLDKAYRQGEVACRVASGQWQYEVDFTSMTQTNTEHYDHTVRKVRRV